MTETEIEMEWQQALSDRGYLVLGSDSRYSIGQIVEKPTDHRGDRKITRKLHVVGYTVASDMTEQRQLWGLIGPSPYDYEFYYRVIAE